MLDNIGSYVEGTGVIECSGAVDIPAAELPAGARHRRVGFRVVAGYQIGSAGLRTCEVVFQGAISRSGGGENIPLAVQFNRMFACSQQYDRYAQPGAPAEKPVLVHSRNTSLRPTYLPNPGSRLVAVNP